MKHAVVDTVADIGTGIKNLIVGGDKEEGDKDIEEKKEDLKDDLKKGKEFV
jgi:hypothetical protein